MREQKKTLRKEIKQKVAAFEPEYLAASDAAIAKKLLALDAFKNAKTVFIYVSVGREPHTHALIEAALAAGKRVCVPVCLGGGVMEARQITSLDEVRETSMGLLEPDERAPVVPPEAFDLVVAPCVATDKKNTRLGHGAGYYDLFLTAVRCPVVCLCRGRLQYDALPAEAFDVPMDLVLTEES